MKGCLLFVAAFIGCFGAGQVVIEVLRAGGVDEPLGSSIGTAVWLFSFLTLIAYSPLWMDWEKTASQINPRSLTPRERRAESKLQTAEFRMGAVFGLLGGAFASVANGSDMVVWTIAILCALVGGCMGYDIKRRVRRLREQFAAEQAARFAIDPSDYTAERGRIVRDATVAELVAEIRQRRAGNQ
jgi:hypothetical protein